VPARYWQAARSSGDYSLVTCTVGPGFDFADFRMLADAPHEAEAFGKAQAAWKGFV
jgi:predicted cupin superfamily sugar epimerase